MQVDIWSDIVCPWCYLGKRRFEKALAEFPHAGEVDVRWRSFELNPAAESSDTPMAQVLRDEHGLSEGQLEEMFDRLTALAAAEGLAFRPREAKRINSFGLHRLMKAADEAGVGDQTRELLMDAHHGRALNLSDPAVVAEVLAPTALPTSTILAGDAYADDVRADETRARRLGITGVPAFVLADTYLVSGAQPVAALTAALTQAWRETTA